MSGTSGAVPGLPLRVEEHGSGGRPLVLIHGFGAHSYTWRHWVPRLRDRYRVLTVDLKGHGAAPRPRDRAYSPRDQAELVIRALRAREVEDATLVGHSLGGGIALLVALRTLDADRPRLHSLVLVAGAAYRQEIPRFIDWARKPLVGRILLGMLPARLLIRWVLRSIVHDPATVTPQQVEAYAGPLSSPGGRRAILQAARQLVPDDLERIVARYPEIDLPTLLLWGREDEVVPPWVGERLARTLPRARLEILDACGHIPPEERPDESLRVLRAFLDEMEAGETGEEIAEEDGPSPGASKAEAPPDAGASG